MPCGIPGMKRDPTFSFFRESHMRNLFSKTATVAMLAGAALSIAACSKHDDTNAADTNMTDMNTMDSSAGMTNDMSAMDATGADANMGGDNSMGAMGGDNSSNAM